MTRVDWNEPYTQDGEDSFVRQERLMQRRRDRQIQDGLIAEPERWVYGRQVRFGDDASRDSHLRRCRAIQRGMRVPFEVAPLHQIRLMSGHILRPGDAVRPEHFQHEDEKRLPGLLISRLVALGVVLEADAASPDDGPPAAA